MKNLFEELKTVRSFQSAPVTRIPEHINSLRYIDNEPPSLSTYPIKYPEPMSIIEHELIRKRLNLYQEIRHKLHAYVDGLGIEYSKAVKMLQLDALNEIENHIRKFTRRGIEVFVHGGINVR